MRPQVGHLYFHNNTIVKLFQLKSMVETFWKGFKESIGCSAVLSIFTKRYDVNLWSGVMLWRKALEVGQMILSQVDTIIFELHMWSAVKYSKGWYMSSVILTNRNPLQDTAQLLCGYWLMFLSYLGIYFISVLWPAMEATAAFIYFQVNKYSNSRQKLLTSYNYDYSKSTLWTEAFSNMYKLSTTASIIWQIWVTYLDNNVRSVVVSGNHRLNH